LKILNSLNFLGDFLQISENRFIFASFKIISGRKMSPNKGGYFYAYILLKNKANAAPRRVTGQHPEGFT
jgi:hypothetical protein